MRFLGDDGNPRAPMACEFFGGIVSGLLGGGGSSTSVSSNQNVQVDVEVNPNIGVAVDLEPVSELAAEIAAGNIQTGEQLAEALGGQGVAFLSGFKALADSIGEQGKVIAIVAAAGFALLYFGRAKA